MIPESEMREAWDRIGRTADGQLAYLYLQRTLMGTIASNDQGALQADNGRRTFASELMSLMSKGLAESDRTDRANRPVVFATGAQPVAVGRRSLPRGGPGEPGSSGDAEPTGPVTT